ncbi:CheR family methyltransferase [Methylobacterium sp. J-068]|uniref:CheR family methyltransferase n=1 Tax=Methylobacterium sp. J-068 TaxID=2836649 RepID=UPI001FBA23A2|nr:CheR family methyltransferase [Methylobacterium sp. J-068]MCJ2034031.1 chemotaxis protein CheR [Methylobacterium sp. J-068]
MPSLTQGLSERHFRSIVNLIETEVGIQLPAAKRTMLEGRLRKRVRALDLDGLEAYGRHLFDEGHLDEEYIHLVDCVTTNKTDFFREPAHFELLRDALVPRLAARKAGTVRLKLWSAAASIGAEAYTLAMILQDMVAGGHSLDYAILGTDVSTEVLKVGRTGIYTNEMLSTVPPEMRRRYVMAARDPTRQEGRIVPELRARVRFQHLNLMADGYDVDRDIDIIFCRNVLIYFDKATQQAVLERLATHLRPGGYLIVGHSESMAGSGLTRLTQVSSTVFRK